MNQHLFIYQRADLRFSNFRCGPTNIMNCNDPPLFNFDNNNTQQFLAFLFEFKELYNPIHRYIAVILCLCGLLANSVHIWVLTRPRMRISSVHTVLTIIAVSDMGTMISYLIYMLRFEFHYQKDGYAYWWITFLKFHVMSSIACHAITLYLVVLMAFIRWNAMAFPSTSWLRCERAGIAAIVIIFSVVLLCIPTLLAHEIYIQKSSESSVREIRYSIGFSDMMLTNNCFFLKGNLWLTGIFLKAVPCFCLFFLTLALIHQLRVNIEKRKALIKRDEKHRRKGDLTTYMLLFMVSVFLFTELPQGVIAILNALYTSQFHSFVYYPLADVLDLLSLVNCYVAFLVYICTCSRYRQTLRGILPLDELNKMRSNFTTRNNTINKSPDIVTRTTVTQMRDQTDRLKTERLNEQKPLLSKGSETTIRLDPASGDELL